MARSRIIRRRMAADELADLQDRRIVTNRMDQPGFDPLTSGRSKADTKNEPWVNLWLRSLQPEVISNEETIITRAGVWDFSPLPPTEYTRIASMRLPAPMPVAVNLSAWSAGDISRIRLPRRFSAEISQQGFAPGFGANPGIFLIEWGQGKARNYLVTNLAPGSVQIPVAQFVNVSAFVGDDGSGQGSFAVGSNACVAGVQLYPGATVENASAEYTGLVQSSALAVSNFIAGTIPPYGRQVSGQISGATPAGSLAGEFDLTEGGIIGARWVMFAADTTIPPVATARTSPQDFRSQPLTGGVRGYTVRLRTPPVVGTASAAITFTIKIT